MSETLFIFSILLFPWACYGIIHSIKYRKWLILSISFVGLVIASVLTALMVGALHAGLNAEPANGAFCGTGMMDKYLAAFRTAGNTYIPWIFVSLLVAGTGGWTSFFEKKAPPQSVPPRQNPDIPFEIPGNEQSSASDPNIYN